MRVINFQSANNRSKFRCQNEILLAIYTTLSLQTVSAFEKMLLNLSSKALKSNTGVAIYASLMN